MRLPVIIPVHNGGNGLRRCLEALAASTRPPDEVIVVDDASTDGSGDLARRRGARVVRLDGPPHGPAFARNRGTEMAQGDVLVFCDADVAVHPDTLARVERYLVEHPEIAALFGSHDDAPPARGLVTRYKNLLHHHIHQHGHREASTFWAGCGAIRREVFVALGGFDAAFFPFASEDRDFCNRWLHHGYRMIYAREVLVYHAHALTFRTFLRQHFSYGCGAFRFHKARARRGSGRFMVEVEFYLNLLKLLLDLGSQIPGRRALLLATLLVMWQVANTAGFLWEWVDQITGKRDQR